MFSTSRSAKTSWIEIRPLASQERALKSRSAKTSWIEIWVRWELELKDERRGLRRPRGLKYSLMKLLHCCVASRSAKTSWIEILVDYRYGPYARSRGLRRPRGLKSAISVSGVEDKSRGLRRPRGLKYLSGNPSRCYTLSRSAKTSWIEIKVDTAHCLGLFGRGLRRPRGLKSVEERLPEGGEEVEVCEDLVD